MKTRSIVMVAALLLAVSANVFGLGFGIGAFTQPVSLYNGHPSVGVKLLLHESIPIGLGLQLSEELVDWSILFTSLDIRMRGAGNEFVYVLLGATVMTDTGNNWNSTFNIDLGIGVDVMRWNGFELGVEFKAIIPATEELFSPGFGEGGPVPFFFFGIQLLKTF